MGSVHALRGQLLGGRLIGGTMFHPARGNHPLSVARGGGGRGVQMERRTQTPRDLTGCRELKGGCDGEKFFAFLAQLTRGQSLAYWSAFFLPHRGVVVVT
jgi:hypothetical protein